MHPIAFKIGTWPITWYGMLVAVGFIAGLWTAGRRAPRTGVSPDLVGDAGPWIILGTVIGARLLYVATYWQESFAKEPWWEALMVQHGGLVFYGGLIGASIAIILYCFARKIPLWRFADVLAPSIALGYVFGRLGCLMNGCCYGSQCTLPWAITYPRGHETFRLDAAAGIPVHPTQLYDASFSLLLYATLAWIYRRKRFDGQVFCTYLICYAFTRSFVEHFRGDYNAAHRHIEFFTPAQLVSVGILGTGVVLSIVLRKRSRSGQIV